jgi:hypothetical protein
VVVVVGVVVVVVVVVMLATVAILAEVVTVSAVVLVALALVAAAVVTAMVLQVLLLAGHPSTACVGRCRRLCPSPVRTSPDGALPVHRCSLLVLPMSAACLQPYRRHGSASRQFRPLPVPHPAITDYSVAWMAPLARLPLARLPVAQRF